MQLALPQIGAPRWRCRRFDRFAVPRPPRRLDRNLRTRLMLRAELFERDSHVKGEHGGYLKRTGLAVLRALLFGYLSCETLRCDPSLTSIAKAAGVARSTAVAALERLQAVGLLSWQRRAYRMREGGRVVLRQATNSYAFAGLEGEVVVESDSRSGTNLSLDSTSSKDGASAMPAELRAALEGLRRAIGGAAPA